MSEHTPEPWPEPDKNGHISEPRIGCMDYANYMRARACVNACAGIDDPQDLRTQRDDLLSAAEAQQELLDAKFGQVRMLTNEVKALIALLPEKQQQAWLNLHVELCTSEDFCSGIQEGNIDDYKSALALCRGVSAKLVDLLEEQLAWLASMPETTVTTTEREIPGRCVDAFVEEERLEAMKRIIELAKEGGEG